MIRVLQPADLDRADAMLRGVFASARAFQPRLARYLAIEPEGWFVAEEDGELVGTLGANTHGAVAYLGLMAVPAARQRRGLGRALLEHALAWLEARGVVCAMLDATDAGAHLYEQLGFTDAGPSHEVACAAAAVTLDPDDAARDAVRVLAGDELDALIALDARCFGAARPAMWRRLLDEHRDRVLVAHADDDARALTGYLCVQPQTLGPWGATTDAATRGLLAASRGFATEAQIRVLVPGEHPDALAYLAARGFREVRRVRHMRRGAPPASIAWHRLLGKASFCLG